MVSMSRRRQSLLDVNNGITFRFLPGVIVGFILHKMLSGLGPETSPLDNSDSQISTDSAENSSQDTESRRASIPSRSAGSSGTALVTPISSSTPAPKEEYKLVLCVNQELKMTKGKIAAQCCHAAVAVVQQFRRRMPLWFRAWEQGGQAKIALRVENTRQLLDLSRQAHAAKLPHYVVADAGRTQIAAGSNTVLAIGPAPVSRINLITGRLALL